MSSLVTKPIKQVFLAEIRRKIYFFIQKKNKSDNQILGYKVASSLYLKYNKKYPLPFPQLPFSYSPVIILNPPIFLLSKSLSYNNS